MDNNTFIQLVITILSSGTVAWFLKQQIESQKKEISTLKSSFDSLEKYVKIINVDEFEKYVSMTKKTTVMEMSSVAQDAIKKVFETDELKNILKTTFDEQLGKKYMELLEYAADAVLLYPEDEQDAHIKEAYPHNYQNLKNLLADMKKEGYDIPESEKQNFVQIRQQMKDREQE